MARTKPAEERRFAFRFLVHCLQDTHMPCHVGDNGDKGAIRRKFGSTIAGLGCTRSGMGS